MICAIRACFSTDAVELADDENPYRDSFGYGFRLSVYRVVATIQRSPKLRYHLLYPVIRILQYPARQAQIVYLCGAYSV